MLFFIYENRILVVEVYHGSLLKLRQSDYIFSKSFICYPNFSDTIQPMYTIFPLVIFCYVFLSVFSFTSYCLGIVTAGLIIMRSTLAVYGVIFLMPKVLMKFECSHLNSGAIYPDPSVNYLAGADGLRVLIALYSSLFTKMVVKK